MEEKVRYGLIACGAGFVITVLLFVANNAGWLSMTTPGWWQALAMLVAWPVVMSFSAIGLYAMGSPSFMQSIAPFLMLLSIIFNLVYLYILGLIVYKLKCLVVDTPKTNYSKKHR